MSLTWGRGAGAPHDQQLTIKAAVNELVDISQPESSQVNYLIMKVFFSLAFLVALTLAEPPSYRQQSQRERNTYYVAKQQEAEELPEADAPYQPSGWKPDGPAFELPQKQQPASSQQQFGPAQSQKQYAAPVKAAPQRQYGAPATPQQQYGAPSTPPQQYGPPQAPTTIEPNSPDFEESTSPSTQAEPVESNVNELDESGSGEQQRQSGEYYIALPDGRLQRVRYISSQDIEAMKYFAKIRAENVEPLRGPIYNYQPLQKLQFAPAQLQVAYEDRPIVPAAPVRENNPRSEKIQAPAKAEVQPLAAQVGSLPLTSSFAGYSAKYELPTPIEQRYLVSF